MNFPTYIFIINVNLNCVVCLYAKLDKLWEKFKKKLECEFTPH